MSVYGKTLIFRQHFAPLLVITVDCPIVAVESAPENCSSVPVKELFGKDSAVMGFNIHDVYGIITLSANRNGISSDNVKQEILVGADNCRTVSPDIAFDGQIGCIAAVVFAKAPVLNKFITVKECDIVTHIPVISECRKMEGKLNEYLHKIDEQARDMVDSIVSQMVEQRAVNEDLKVRDSMRWVLEMNKIKLEAEESVMNDLIY